MNENKGFDAFSRFAANKSFSLVGMGVSNLPLISLLYKAGAKKVVARDKNLDRDSDKAKKIVSDGAVLKISGEYLSELTEDVIIRSPGIRPDIPEFLTAEENGAVITCETDLFLEFAEGVTVGITGSDGKTTTTTLISKFLEASGKKVLLGGNIGNSMLSQLEKTSEDTFSVIELSSFQLMNSKNPPYISVVTNVSENHLNWHKDMDEYVAAKKNILSFQKPDSVSVLNLDNDYTKSFPHNGKNFYFSKAPADFENCVFANGGVIYYRKDNITESVLNISDIKLKGTYNLENYMAAIGAVYGYADKESMAKVARDFCGVEHRTEFIRKFNGILFYNSSIDSSPSRTISTLSVFDEKNVVILGGYDKNLDYSPLGKVLCEKTKGIVLCGTSAPRIKEAVESYPCKNKPVILETEDFYQTVFSALKIAEKGDRIILSPASASFDRFTNFEERGRIFKEIVNGLK